ncbi:MAG: type II secretion system GspH family protein [Oscillospiraceae bacterium]|nr:type II secretion system GspH family protein [Oscillospiraceae bacterium]
MLKRIKRLFGRRNNAGFTMVEVIVSIALLGIMILGVLGFMAPVMSIVADGEKNARGVMLMEAIDSYITNSLRYAEYVKIYSNVKQGTDPTDGDADFTEMTGYVNATHELRCISFSWMETGIKDQYKLVLRQNRVDQSTFKIAQLANGKPDAVSVMGDCIYDDLYIVPQFRLIDNNYDVPSPADPSITTPKYADGDPNLHYIGFQNVTQVYRDNQCYSTEAANRANSSLAYVGESFTACTTIASNYTNKLTAGGYKYKIYEINEGVYDATSVTTQIDEDTGMTLYYPETYIYYVARKFDTITTP